MFDANHMGTTQPARPASSKKLRAMAALGLLASAAIMGLPREAGAIGCLSGAAAGGVAGHYAGHHGILGAVAGCAVGHHAGVVQRRRAAAAAAAQQNGGASYPQGGAYQGDSGYQQGAPVQQ